MSSHKVTLKVLSQTNIYIKLLPIRKIEFINRNVLPICKCLVATLITFGKHRNLNRNWKHIQCYYSAFKKYRLNK